MTEETRKRVLRVEELLRQRREIDRELELLLDPTLQDMRLPDTPEKKQRPVIPTLHTFVEEVLRAHPDGLTTKEVLAALNVSHPELVLMQHAITASLVYLTHKKGIAERIGQGRYRLILNEDRRKR